jgi:hypothetical protein
MNMKIERSAYTNWGGNSRHFDVLGFTGVITYCEREYFNGKPWGCSRYYNENDELIGQEWYGEVDYSLEKARHSLSGGLTYHTAACNAENYKRVKSEFYRSQYWQDHRSFANHNYHGKTGLSTVRRPDGTRIHEREWRDGTAWGCHRYYDEQEKLLGQEYYGGTSSPITPRAPRPVKIPGYTTTWPSEPFYTALLDGQEELAVCKGECEKERLATYVKSLTSQVATLPGFVELLCHSPAETTTSYGDIVDDLLSKYTLTFSFLLLRKFPSVWSTPKSSSVSAESTRKPAIDETPARKETLLQRLVALKQECFTLQRQLEASEDLRLALQDQRSQKSALAEESQELVVLKRELTSLHAEHAALREQLEQERATRGKLAGELAKLLVPTLRAASAASQQRPDTLLERK